jgi:hypothetical protein
MTKPRAFGALILGLLLSTSVLESQGRSQYRDFKLGADLPSVSKLANVAASDAKTIHSRPAMMQDLQWRPGYFVDGSTARVNDPVQQIVFSFYNDQLFRMVIDYDRQRTNGMTDADMTEAVAQSYGAQAPPAAKKAPAPPSQVDTESGTVLARWAGADYGVTLYRSSYASGFRLVVLSPQLSALARAADVESVRLDAREAPQREAARQKKEDEDRRQSQDKARTENKKTFRP